MTRRSLAGAPSPFSHREAGDARESLRPARDDGPLGATDGAAPIANEIRSFADADLCACATSLASLSAQIALLAQRMADAVRRGAGSSGGDLALLAPPEPCHDSVEPAAPIAATERESLVLSARQVARLLGVHERTFRRMRAAKEGPKAITLGGALRYRRRDVERWLEQRR